MKLGFLTDGTVEDVKFARKYGFDCLEVALFGDTPLFDDPSEFKKACDGEGIPVAAVSLFGQDYTNADEAVRKETAERLIKMGELAGKLEAPVAVAGAGTGPAEMRLRDRLDRCIKIMTPLIQKVTSFGPKFAFYNCSWVNDVCTPEAWIYTLPKIPGAGIKFDPSHPAYDNRDWRPELVAAGPDILHTHAKDVLRVRGKLIPDPNPGLGDINWGAFFGLLYEVGYDGAVCIEPHSSIYAKENRYPGLVLSGKYLRQFMLPEL